VIEQLLSAVSTHDPSIVAQPLLVLVQLPSDVSRQLPSVVFAQPLDV
jgi:hypothetical protein